MSSDASVDPVEFVLNEVRNRVLRILCIADSCSARDQLP